jgi:hypothetical protein
MQCPSGEEKEAARSQAAMDPAASRYHRVWEQPSQAFTAYNCSNRSNIVKLYSLLEPDACAASGGNREMETVVYGEIVQMKQYRIIPISRC